MTIYLKLLQVIVWLVWKVYKVDLEAFFRDRQRIVFSKVRLSDGIVIEGDITKMKVEFGQRIRVTATPRDGSGIQAGSAVWAVSAADADGNDRSSDWTAFPNPDGGNELVCDFQHSGTTESIGVASLTADGDRDTDETFEVVGTLALVVDEPNTTAFDMSGSVVEQPTPEA